MRWLLVGKMTPAVKDALVRHGHTAVTPTEAGIPEDATPFELLVAAHAKQLDLFTSRADLAGAPFEQAITYDRSLVFLQYGEDDVEQDDAVDRLFARYKRLTPQRLYTVTQTRVKVRQLPTSRST